MLWKGKMLSVPGILLEFLLPGFDRRCLNVIGKDKRSTASTQNSPGISLQILFHPDPSTQPHPQLGQPGVAGTWWLLRICVTDVLLQFIPSWHFSRSAAHLPLFDLAGW